MKTIKLFLLTVAAAAGLAVGYFRFRLFYTFYDVDMKILSSQSSAPLLYINAAVLIFAFLIIGVCIALFKKQVIRKNGVRPLGKILIFTGGVLTAISGFMAALSYSNEIFELVFAVSAFATFAAVFMVTSKSSRLSGLFSCILTFPSAFLLLYLYRNNLKYPSVSLFSFEIIATLFIMLAFYYIAASHFKEMSAVKFMACALLAVFFCFSSAFTNILVKEYRLFDTILPYYSEIYFAASLLIICAYFFNLKPFEKVNIIFPESGFAIQCGDKSIMIDCDDGAFIDEYNPSAVFFSADVPTTVVRMENFSPSKGFTEEESTEHNGFTVFPHILEDSGIEGRGFLITAPSGINTLYFVRDDWSGISKKTFENFVYECEADNIVLSGPERYRKTAEKLCSSLLIECFYIPDQIERFM